MVRREQTALRRTGARRGARIHPVHAGSAGKNCTAFHGRTEAHGWFPDARFSKNKSPYKTNIGIQFRHENARDVHAPGYYLHIDSDEVFLGVGMWQPEAIALAAVRKRIDAKQSEWLKARDDRKFRGHFELGGESLSRPPKGISKDHPLLDDLRRKDFIAVKNLEPTDPLHAHFQRHVESAFVAATPFMTFLCKAVGVAY